MTAATEKWMPVVSFAFRTQAVQVDFDPPPGLVARLRASLGPLRGDVLNLNHVASADERLLLQSPTGSTQVEVVAGRITMQTQLFGDSADPAAGNRRADYMKSKLEFMLTAIEGAGAAIHYLGVSTEARMSASSFADPTELRRAAVAAAGVQPELTGGQLCYDFTLRASRVMEDGTYANVTLQWYQDRAVTLQMIDPTQTVAARFAMWDLPLADEGLQFQYDRNNKAALFAGRRRWSAAEFVAMAGDAIAAAPGALAELRPALAAALPGSEVT